MKIKTWLVISLMFLAAGIGYTQPPATTSGPQVTPTERAALQTVQQEWTQVMTLFKDVSDQIKKDHPGYELTPQNPLSGVLVPIPPAPKPAPKPEPEKVTPEKK